MRARDTVALALILLTASAEGAPVVYEGGDPGAGPGDAHPNTTAAGASFDAAAVALGTLQRIDFESLPLGSFTSMTLAPGVTATLSNVLGPSGIRNDDVNLLRGYNTTAAGAQFLRVNPSPSTAPILTLTLAFDRPIVAFGTNIVGLGDTASGMPGTRGWLHVNFDDGQPQSIAVTGQEPGGVQFFGFTTADTPISEVRIVLDGWPTDDVHSFDDIRYVESPLVPEPATLALLSLGALGSAAIRRRRVASSRARQLPG